MEERKSKTLERRLRGLECENYRELRYLLDKGLELPGDLKYCVSCNAPENCLRYKPKGCDEDIVCNGYDGRMEANHCDFGSVYINGLSLDKTVDG